jgi:hypothetical protein
LLLLPRRWLEQPQNYAHLPPIIILFFVDCAKKDQPLSPYVLFHFLLCIFLL